MCLQAVYFLLGYSHDTDDLLRANVGKAYAVVLMPQNIEEPGCGLSMRECRKDTLVVLAHQHLMCLAPNVPVLTELVEGTNQASACRAIHAHPS